MVITVTLNPALDKTLTVEALTPGEVNRVISTREDIGGKGINVSKVLKNLGIESVCTGFLGGMLEKVFIEELKKQGIGTNFVAIKGSTRINTKIIDPISKLCTDINEPGPNIEKEELAEFLKKFTALCMKDDIVVLSGGVSASVPRNIYQILIQIASDKGAISVLDAEGILLEEGLKAKPTLIKPNKEELKKLLNIKSDSYEDIIEGAKKLIGQGIKEVVVSLGSEGAIFITEDRIYKAKALRVPVKSTVGAGDSVVAALVYGKLKGMSIEETLSFGTACGAASVSLEGTEACTLEQINELLPKVEIIVEERR